MKIGMVVAEVSGDNLAAHFIRALKKRCPTLEVEGILGPSLLKEGGKTFYPMERLSVMGIIDPLKRLPELLKMRRAIIKHFIEHKPDVFIGVDAPDFNLGIEKALKKHRIKTVHYVSPSVWAWRQGRVKTIRAAVDLMLSLLPFEAAFFEKHQVPVCFTGHPLADQIPLEPNTKEAKEALGFKENDKVIALLPGSRLSELKYLAPTFLKTAVYCFEKNRDLKFIMPLVSKEQALKMEALYKAISPKLPLKITVGNSYTAMESADAVLVTSGTATLEVMLYKKPMVVAYKMHPFNYFVGKRLVKLSHIALPNLLAGTGIVPEFIQEKATPEALGEALLDHLNSKTHQKVLLEKFRDIHLSLKKEASVMAVDAVLQLLEGNGRA